MALGSVGIGLAFGGTLGVLGGYFGRWPDRLIMGAMTVLLCFPGIILAIALVSSLGPSVGNVTFAIGVIFIPAFARIARANTLSLRSREFVLAAQSLGAKLPRILVREILPNLMPALLSYAVVMLGVAILAEAALGFLGLSVRPPRPSWGGMIAAERGNLADAPHAVFIPAAVMFVTVLPSTGSAKRRAACSTSGRNRYDRTAAESTRPFDPLRHAAGPRACGQQRRLRPDAGTDARRSSASPARERACCRAQSCACCPRALRAVREKSCSTARTLQLLGEPDLRKVRGKDIAMIFQDPMSSLNPVLTIERQIGEVLELHLGLAAAERRQRTIALLRSVGIAAAEQRLREYPHQLSGGLRQRVMIAMALACRPRLLIADEPTTALDVTIQMQILVLLKRQQRETGMAMIFISHDLAAVGGIADEVAVMYGGRFVEQAPTDAFFKRRLMPYSEALLKARPDPFAPRGARLEAIGGRPPDLTALPPGCSFAARCSRQQPDCLQSTPPLTTERDRRYACFHPLASVA